MTYLVPSRTLNLNAVNQSMWKCLWGCKYSERESELLLVWQVMQIFFPYSIQQHPREFPGEDPRDCPRNVNKEESVLDTFTL